MNTICLLPLDNYFQKWFYRSMVVLRKASEIKKMKQVQVKVITSPVVNDQKTSIFKTIFGLFSQFVTIGGDFV